MNDDRLKTAAENGNINLLYTLIQENPKVLESEDSIPFAETPLHIAASFGQLQFATEVMRLKPSFALKLNPQGYSPIHVAMQQGQKRMALGLVDINKDLVRVKGKEGLTPLHFASEIEDVELLASFLFACPDSIEDVTVRNETALHIAVKQKNYEALQVLVGWLERTSQKNAMNLEKTILNWKNEAGNTILHISALMNESKALRLLVKTKVDLNSKNLENSTALDIAATAEIRSILCGVGAKHGSLVTNAPTLAHKLTSEITVMEQIRIPIRRIRRDISDEQRNAFLVVVALVVSATFQSVLSPPGGVYQANIGDNNVNTNTTSLNSTSTATATQRIAGTTVLSEHDFLAFSASNALSLLTSTSVILMLTPSGTMGVPLVSTVYLLLSNYLYCMKVISPTPGISRTYYIAFYVYFVVTILFIYMLAIKHWILGQPVRLLRKVRDSYNMLLKRLQRSN